MNCDHDQTERALTSLRSVQWDGPTFDPTLEEKLMNQFSTQQSNTSARRRVGPIVALAIVLVGGGAFAAAGGIDMIRSLFVTVDIEGQPVQVELTPTGENTYEGSLNTQLADGRTADINVVRSEPEPNSRQMEVRVAVSDDDEGEQHEAVEHQIHKQRLNVGRPDPSAVFTLDDLGDNQPIHTWTNAEGQAKAVYAVNRAETSLLEIYSTLGQADGTTVVKQLAKLPAELFAGTPQVSIADNGDVRLVWDSGDGETNNRREIRLRDKSSATKSEETLDIDAALPDSPIKVRLGPNAVEKQDSQ